MSSVKLRTVQVTRLPWMHKISKMGTIYPAEPVLTEGLCVVHKEEFSKTCYMCERPSILIRDKPIFSSERMLHMDYYRKVSVEKISGRKSQGA
jgi:hypothetical protein